MPKIAASRLHAAAFAALLATSAHVAAAPVNDATTKPAGDSVAADTLATPAAEPAPVTTGALPVEPKSQSDAQPAASDSTETAPAAAAPASPSPTPAAAPVVTAPPADGVPAAAPAAETPAAGAAAAAPATTADPIVDAIRRRLADDAAVTKADPADVAALKTFYDSRTETVWVKDGAYTDAAKALIAELNKADDWGLESAVYSVADTAPGSAPEALATAETTLAIAALRYARDARGGRIDPRKISSIWDVSGEFKDPAAVLADLSTSPSPDAVLRGLHPQHPQFEALRQALLKARGVGEQPAAPVDEALLVKLPDDKASKTLKAGMDHQDVALLRKRLKIETPIGTNPHFYDEGVAEAVLAYQAANGLKPNGRLDRRTRTALNREGEPEKPKSKDSTIQNLLVNMERWRWLPADMGSYYVWNNVPEFVGRVIKDGKPLFEERIIVGQPSWPTPMLTDSIERIAFRPTWGVPDGIKVKELLPRLKRASPQSGGGFFDELFGGGSSGGSRVLQAYGLTPSINGRPVDPDSVDWHRVDIRRFSFVQPPGAQNPLGKVKFLFPNRHDVYMHDTTQRNLFSASRRALSHGCIRVKNPERLSEVLMEQDKGWSADRVANALQSGGEFALDKPVPVYLTYFTARADDDGTIKTFSDIYGNDRRVLSALAGRPVRYEAPDHSGEDVADDATVSAIDDEAAGETPARASNKKKSKQASATQSRKRRPDATGDLISNTLSGLLFN